MTRAERVQQKTDEVLLKLEGMTWKRSRAGFWYLWRGNLTWASIDRPRKRYYAYVGGFAPTHGGPFRSLVKAKAFVAEKLGCSGRR
jgi:hypothetical protein